MGVYASICCAKDNKNANFNLQDDFNNESEEGKIIFY